MDVSSRNDLRLGGIAELFERQQQLRFCIERCEVIYGKERRNGPGALHRKEDLCKRTHEPASGGGIHVKRTRPPLRRISSSLIK